MRKCCRVRAADKEATTGIGPQTLNIGGLLSETACRRDVSNVSHALQEVSYWQRKQPLSL